MLVDLALSLLVIALWRPFDCKSASVISDAKRTPENFEKRLEFRSSWYHNVGDDRNYY